ncbi:hypothetical protein ZIOFF_047125 [Zingiber officinale]|uniref:GRAM domain-containing protein n=1 Tax=Zingiber officinale TaxID=94328 RepID=A0A8J5G5P6_ZINOF|nr:hypothetical protein ZIOFF_047125 [Zingiber officinale]
MNTCSMKTGPSITDAAMGRITQTTKVISEGGYEKVFHQTFEILPGEKLKKSYACYLLTSSGPVMGVLYLSTANLAFCSDNPLSYKVGDQTQWYLRNNLLLGGIPMEIGMLKNLTLLDLSVNRLIGPTSYAWRVNCRHKIVRNLHSNGLTGKIPQELGKLKNLVELRLDRNRLEGQIPGVTMSNFSATLHTIGQGLMLGIELVTDRKEKMPTKAETVVLFEKLKDLGVLLGKGGLQGNVFGIKPPMCFTKEDAVILRDYEI